MKRSLLILTSLLYLSHSFALQEKNQKKAATSEEQDLYQKDLEVFFMSGEFLYWRAETGAVDYAFEMKKNAWGPSDSYAQGKQQRAQYHFDPGFRAAFGYFNAPKYWEVMLQYTYFYDRGNNVSEKPTEANLFINPTWPTIFTTPVQRATSLIQLHYNLLELLVDRVFIPNPHFRLRFIGGIPLTYTKQRWQVQYFDGLGAESKILNRWRFRGIGLKLGTMMDWYWGADFYVTGLVTTSCLIGGYRNLSFQKTNVNPGGVNNPDVPIRNALRKDVRAVYNIQFLLGPSYQKAFKKARLEIFAGYELAAWFNLQEIYRSTAGSPSAPKETWQETSLLALQGLTTRLTVNF